MEKVIINIHQWNKNKIPVLLNIYIYGTSNVKSSHFMDSYTEKGNILNNFRLGIFITILNHKQLYKPVWDKVEYGVCK